MNDNDARDRVSELAEIAWYEVGTNLVYNRASRDACLTKGFRKGYDAAQARNRELEAEVERLKHELGEDVDAFALYRDGDIDKFFGCSPDAKRG